MALTGQVFFEEKMFEDCGIQMDNGACLYYKLTYEPKGSSALKKARWKQIWNQGSF